MSRYGPEALWRWPGKMLRKHPLHLILGERLGQVVGHGQLVSAVLVAGIDRGSEHHHHLGQLLGQRQLLGLKRLEFFTKPGNPQLLTRCTVWYGADARTEWYRQSGA